MKAIAMDAFGGPEVLVLREVPDPRPAKGQVRIAVAATSVNRADLLQREGLYPPPPGESDVLGLEVAGRVEAVGPRVQRWKPGDRVMGLVAGGGYAQLAVAHADHLLTIPDGMDDVTAAGVCEAYVTAYLNLFIIGRLADRTSVLIHGAGGGVGTAAVQLSHQLHPSAAVLATVSASKADRVQRLGAHRVIDYRKEDFSQAVLAFTGSRGVDLILDHIGAGYLTGNLKALAIGGKLVVIGLLQGAEATVNLARLMVKRQSIEGSVLRSRPVSDKARIVEAFGQNVLPQMAPDRIWPIVDRTYPLEQAGRAHHCMAAGRHFGKIILTVPH
jgi:NADPH2:quinone reductase